MKEEQSLIVNYFQGKELRSFVDDDGLAWFHGGHICTILEYQNPSDAIPFNVEEEDRKKVDIGLLQMVWFVNEYGAYDMILNCRKDVARPFKRWLSHDFLPQYRKNNFYINEAKITTEQLGLLESKVKQLKDCTENLISDIESSFRTKQYLLVYGFLQSASERRYKTFTQLRKDLENQGFVYPIDRLKLALKFLQERTGNEVVATDKTYNIREGEELQVFLHCIYDSMRFEGNPDDTDTTENMENFEKLYGIKPGKQRPCNYETHSVLEHVENAKKLIN